VVAEQLQVLRRCVGLGFSRKIEISASKINEKHVPSGIPSGPAKIFFREERSAGILADGWYMN
jgi:hypothetical protein